MSMQQIMRWGHDFLRIRRGEYLTFGANGEKPNVKGRTHQSVSQLPILSFSPIIKFCQNVVELVIAWGWEEYGQQFRIWGKPIFGENQFWLLGKVITQKCMPFYPTWMFFTFGSSREAWELFLPPCFLLAECSSFMIGLLGISIIIIHHRWGSLKRLGTRSSHFLILLSCGFIFGDDMWLGSFPQNSVAFPQCLSSWKSFLCSQHCNCGVWNSFLAMLGPKRP